MYGRAIRLLGRSIDGTGYVGLGSSLIGDVGQAVGGSAGSSMIGAIKSVGTRVSGALGEGMVGGLFKKKVHALACLSLLLSFVLFSFVLFSLVLFSFLFLFFAVCTSANEKEKEIE